VRVRRTSRASGQQDISHKPVIEADDAETWQLAKRYIEVFGLSGERLWVTTDRRQFQLKLERRVDAGIGGAYIFHPYLETHLVLINLVRIDRAQPMALEVVVAEEFMHMRDWLDGDRRRHSKHGYDRIAYRVAELTGATTDEVRSCLLPRARRPVRYIYRCPGCANAVQRRTRGTWSCARCSPKFDREYVLLLERELPEVSQPESAGQMSMTVELADQIR
jgi:predicted SprT family Zn-dependent metalloprotease